MAGKLKESDDFIGMSGILTKELNWNRIYPLYSWNWTPLANAAYLK